MAKRRKSTSPWRSPPNDDLRAEAQALAQTVNQMSRQLHEVEQRTHRLLEMMRTDEDRASSDMNDRLESFKRRAVKTMRDQQTPARTAGTDRARLEDLVPPERALALRLRSVARLRNVTQKQLAQMLGVTPAVISRVFKHPERSRLTTLRRIADALAVDIHEII